MIKSILISAEVNLSIFGCQSTQVLSKLCAQKRGASKEKKTSMLLSFFDLKF